MDEGLGPKNVMGRQQAMLFMSGHDGNFPDLHPISITLLPGQDIPSEGFHTFSFLRRIKDKKLFPLSFCYSLCLLPHMSSACMYIL